MARAERSPGAGGGWRRTSRRRAPAAPGAWSRATAIDANDGAVRGGREANLSVGLNWYLGAHGRFMANYVRVHSRRHGVSDNPDALLLRA